MKQEKNTTEESSNWDFILFILVLILAIIGLGSVLHWALTLFNPDPDVIAPSSGYHYVIPSPEVTLQDALYSYCGKFQTTNNVVNINVASSTCDIYEPAAIKKFTND